MAKTTTRHVPLFQDGSRIDGLEIRFRVEDPEAVRQAHEGDPSKVELSDPMKPKERLFVQTRGESVNQDGDKDRNEVSKRVQFNAANFPGFTTQQINIIRAAIKEIARQQTADEGLEPPAE